MEPIRAEHSDSDISEDWNVIEARETFTASLSESESIEVIGDDLDSAVSADENGGNLDENNPIRRPLVTDEETIHVNESVTSRDETSLTSHSTLATQPLLERSLNLRPSTSLQIASNSTLLFISNQMFAFLMLLVAVSLSYTGGRGAFSTLINLGSNPFMTDSFTSEEYNSLPENMDGCSKRLTQAEKKIENIRLAALSLEEGTMSLPVFMDFIKDIGRPAYISTKIKFQHGEDIDFASKKKFLGDKIPKFEEKRSNNFKNFEENVHKFQNVHDERPQYSRKFVGQKSDEKILGKFDDKILQNSGKLDESFGNSREFDRRRLQHSGKFNGNSRKLDGKKIVDENRRIDENIGDQNDQQFSKSDKQLLKGALDYKFKNQTLIYKISLVLKNSPQSELKQLSEALFNMSRNLNENFEKIAKISLKRDDKYVGGMLKKFSMISSKIDQQVLDFFKRLVEKFSKNLDKIGEHVKKFYCDGKIENCRENGRGDREPDKNIEQNFENRVKINGKLVFSEDVGKIKIDDRKRISDEKYLEKKIVYRDSEKHFEEKKKNKNFAKMKKRDELSVGKNFEKGEKRKDYIEEEEKFKIKKKEYKGDKKRKIFDGNNDRYSGEVMKNEDISSGKKEKSPKNSVNDDFRLKKNFVQMSFEEIDEESFPKSRYENIGSEIRDKNRQSNDFLENIKMNKETEINRLGNANMHEKVYISEFDNTKIKHEKDIENFESDDKYLQSAAEKFIAHEIETSSKQREGMDSNFDEILKEKGEVKEEVSEGGEVTVEMEEEDSNFHENKQFNKDTNKQYINKRVLTDDFFYAVTREDFMKESDDDGLKNNFKNEINFHVPRMELDHSDSKGSEPVGDSKKDYSFGEELHDRDFKTNLKDSGLGNNFGDRVDSETIKSSKKLMRNEVAFDKFTKTDINKLRKQILRATRQNVEKLFDSFVSSLMGDLKGNDENFTKNSEKTTTDFISDWFLLMGDRRSEIRKINSQSDWLFDRAGDRRKWHEKREGREEEEGERARRGVREGKGDDNTFETEWLFRGALDRRRGKKNKVYGRREVEEEKAEWLFRRALEREKCRKNPNSWECRRYSMSNFRYTGGESMLRGKNVLPRR